MVTEKESEDAQSQQAQLSFFKRYFYRSTTVPGAGDDGSDAEPVRRFSVLSRGFLTLVALLCLAIVVTLCAVLATILTRHKHVEQELRRSPVREAIFANFADPVVLKHEDLFYAFATTNAAG
jgi:hypothetical protein